ncbi:DUF2080 family transposase-associated protein [Candidatus Woesearchaeota archaeon]|nr:DUF2080 family transposase-associated protein [Candidatus Woesearchaeota archaeon]
MLQNVKIGGFILKEKAAKFGTSGKLDTPKKYIGKRAYVIIVH